MDGQQAGGPNVLFKLHFFAHYICTPSPAPLHTVCAHWAGCHWMMDDTGWDGRETQASGGARRDDIWGSWTDSRTPHRRVCCGGGRMCCGRWVRNTLCRCWVQLAEDGSFLQFRLWAKYVWVRKTNKVKESFTSQREGLTCPFLTGWGLVRLWPPGCGRGSQLIRIRASAHSCQK